MGNSVRALCSRQDLAGSLVRLSLFLLLPLLISCDSSQAFLGNLLTPTKLELLDVSADMMLLIVRPLSIEPASPLANILLAHHPLHTPVFDVLYRLTLLLDPQPSSPSLEMEAILNLRVRLSLYFLQLNGRLTFLSGSPMVQGYLTTTLWVFLRYVLTVVIFILAVFFVVILLLIYNALIL